VSRDRSKRHFQFGDVFFFLAGWLETYSGRVVGGNLRGRRSFFFTFPWLRGDVQTLERRRSITSFGFVGAMAKDRKKTASARSSSTCELRAAGKLPCLLFARIPQKKLIREITKSRRSGSREKHRRGLAGGGRRTAPRGTGIWMSRYVPLVTLAHRMRTLRWPWPCLSTGRRSPHTT